MVDQTCGKALLDIAGQTLKTKVLGDLKGDVKYQALMVASAMAIAGRQLQAGNVGNQQRHDLMLLLKSGNDEDLETLNRQLATKIRAGDFVEGSEQAHPIQDYLLKIADIKLQISNPGYLKIP